ncbi:hypothetical protein IQ241_20115 [Romeria aff. gracilis LEGE 07310]|uniref:Uncharacterized protein n=1 Tax=Vasconcelosia minhoensis LEGE 07310 TaxID=915328 RepID=A0A8J7AIG3_9CYAN|nr:hypothetical protein [Romeria gracilis]MBE9079574.1 hypothetical protein [Romeria aff. gracilis LEGE 07310]
MDFVGLDHSHHQVESGHHRREHRRVWAVPVAVMVGLPQIQGKRKNQ